MVRKVLFLVGAGLANEDLSMRAISAMKKSKLYIDQYTSFVSSERISFFEGIAGKHVHRLTRNDMEENVGKLVEEAKSSDIAIITGGDPLIATTHKILAIEAEKRNINIEIIHAPSIITASIGESGLDFYRFGSTCTIPMWHEHYKPVSFYETILANHANRLHSLLLIDYNQDSESSMPISEAVRILEESEAHYGKGLITSNTKMVVISNMGSPAVQKLYGTLKVLKSVELQKGPFVMIMPSEISIIENEAMKAMHVHVLDG